MQHGFSNYGLDFQGQKSVNFCSSEEEVNSIIHECGGQATHNKIGSYSSQIVGNIRREQTILAKKFHESK